MYKEVCSCGASMEFEPTPLREHNKEVIVFWRDNHIHSIVVEPGNIVVNTPDAIRQITQSGS